MGELAMSHTIDRIYLNQIQSKSDTADGKPFTGWNCKDKN